ncbi:hypothetical protein BACCIP111899_01168 [Bacillus rhizoplanae]|uniref:Uncharacterized protein n=1 Tax=Bacillus rhizoplanae TaxID=2880966 RepID=A0ABM8Y8B9_9BACI|nr:hypothetical protein BACCIP111899_01168 [Bacillus rhizoplanae]
MGNALVVGLIEKMGQRIMEVETNNICEDRVELSRV